MLLEARSARRILGDVGVELRWILGEVREQQRVDTIRRLVGGEMTHPGQDFEPVRAGHQVSAASIADALPSTDRCCSIAAAGTPELASRSRSQRASSASKRGPA